MNNKKIGLLVLGALTLGLSTNASAYTTGADYTWDATVPNYNDTAVIHEGTIDTSTFAMGATTRSGFSSLVVGMEPSRLP